MAFNPYKSVILKQQIRSLHLILDNKVIQSIFGNDFITNLFKALVGFELIYIFLRYLIVPETLSYATYLHIVLVVVVSYLFQNLLKKKNDPQYGLSIADLDGKVHTILNKSWFNIFGLYTNCMIATDIVFYSLFISYDLSLIRILFVVTYDLYFYMILVPFFLYLYYDNDTPSYYSRAKSSIKDTVSNLTTSLVPAPVSHRKGGL